MRRLDVGHGSALHVGLAVGRRRAHPADEAGDGDCFTAPAESGDTDHDGIPDFLDRDANGDGIDDAMQIGVDTDESLQQLTILFRCL